jgi:gamma-glutamyltranspeptidase
MDALNTHRIIEAFKHGYAQRGYYGDPVDVYLFNDSLYTETLRK